jgi:hypothetical protein
VILAGSCAVEADRVRPRCDGIDLQAWLTWALGRIADHKMTRLDELLAWRYAAPAT